MEKKGDEQLFFIFCAFDSFRGVWILGRFIFEGAWLLGLLKLGLVRVCMDLGLRRRREGKRREVS